MEELNDHTYSDLNNSGVRLFSQEEERNENGEEERNENGEEVNMDLNEVVIETDEINNLDEAKIAISKMNDSLNLIIDKLAIVEVKLSKCCLLTIEDLAEPVLTIRREVVTVNGSQLTRYRTRNLLIDLGTELKTRISKLDTNKLLRWIVDCCFTVEELIKKDKDLTELDKQKTNEAINLSIKLSNSWIVERKLYNEIASKGILKVHIKKKMIELKTIFTNIRSEKRRIYHKEHLLNT